MVQNNIFNEKKMEEFIDIYDDMLVINSPEDNPIEDWLNKLENDELEDEKKNYLKFFTIILERVLGFKIEDINYENNIGSEGRPVEFTFKKDDKDYIVAELKGTKTKDLNKRYNRQQSAIEQVTNYASIKEETQWAFVSNYNEFRIFNPSYREKYISFQFKELTNPEILKQFLLIFSKFSLIEKDIPQTLLHETIIMERELEDEFYQLFSETRLMIIKELEYNMQIDKSEAIHYSQLILNRYIFLCFAEDLHLIPSETTTDTIITPIIKNNIFETTIWDRLNELFRFVYKGNPNKNIYPFKGSLFEEDFRNIIIRDTLENQEEFFKECYRNWKFEEKYDSIKEILGNYKNTLNPIFKNLLIISSFDFNSELDVNILGHIFENSIGDIEEINNQSKSKRKKDGVYYTPNEITAYICRNTIIPYLSLSGTATNTNDLIKEYEKENNLKLLDKKLKNIKIIDPACGSGAFLNKAVDILLEIHNVLYDSMYADDETLDKYFDDLNNRRQIITNNIYGVDLNEESVEITKLSLFLKLATSKNMTKGLELPNLDKNIKCGNSIVTDKIIAKEKALEWKNEFEDVFDNGEFDIVIGNPPYGAKISDEEKKYLKKIIKGGSETAISFIYLGYKKLLKDNGKLGFIVPKAFTYSSNYKDIREKTIKYLETLIDCHKVWKEVKLEQIIFILNKNNQKEDYNIGTLDNKKITIKGKIPKNSYKSFDLLLNDVSPKEVVLAEKIKKSDKYLNDISHNSRGEPKQNKLNKDKHDNDIPTIGGGEIQRDGIHGIKGYLDYNEIKESKKAFINDNSILVQRIIAHIQKPSNHIKITACIPDNQDLAIVDTINQITIIPKISKYVIWAILNSELINWYAYRFIFAKAIRTMQFDNPTTSKIPLPLLDKEKYEKLEKLAEKLNLNYIEMNKYKDKFFNRIREHFEDIKINKKLENFENLDFKNFNKILSKQKFKLTLKQEDEWEDYFNSYKKSCLNIQNDINNLENEINQEVYVLYELTDEEIQIIENSI